MKWPVDPSIARIAPYEPGKPLEEVARQYGVTDAVKLASNENPLGPSPKALEAAGRALADVHRYPDAAAYELTRAVARHCGVAPQQVVVGNGSDEILALLCHVLLRPGTEAVVPKPSFLMYDIVTRARGAEAKVVGLDGLHLDLEAMAAAAGDKTRIVFLCNPNNPTGTVVTHRQMERFLDRLPQQVAVVVDEAYGEFVRDPDCADSLALLRDGRPVVVLRTFSKAYGLAGLRVGYGCMDAELAQWVQRVRMPFNVNRVAQMAAVAALQDTDFLQRTCSLVHREMDRLIQAIEQLGLVCHMSQANFFLVDLPVEAAGLFQRLLRRGVIVRSMASYGMPRTIRITVGRPEENDRLLAALEAELAHGKGAR